MRFYVASKFENQEAVRDAIDRLTALGHVVTHDWTRNEHWGWGTEEDTERLAPKSAVLDVAGVAEADVFIMLTYNHVPMIGALVELGVALATFKQIYIIGEQPRNIFAYHPLVRRVGSLDAVIDILEAEDSTPGRGVSA